MYVWEALLKIDLPHPLSKTLREEDKKKSTITLFDIAQF